LTESALERIHRSTYLPNRGYREHHGPQQMLQVLKPEEENAAPPGRRTQPAAPHGHTNAAGTSVAEVGGGLGGREVPGG
jgi:hypothetical protein